jgi:dipeptidyl aminopeptidase/acylaminoacyl peptidase
MRAICLSAVLLLSTICGFAQESGPQAALPVPANIKVEGMPPIPQSLADAVAGYGQYREARLIAWHPTKRQILITTSFALNPPVPQIHLVDGPGRDRHQLTWVKNGVSTWVFAGFDPADGNTFTFMKDPGGGELGSLYRYNIATGQVSLVTEGRIRHPPVWSRQGKWLLYDSAERNGKDRDLYVIQPADPKTKRRLTEVSGALAPFDWSPDGSKVLTLDVIANTETDLWLVDVKTGERTLLSPKEGPKTYWFSAKFSPDGKRVYAISGRDGTPRLWRCDIATATWKPVTPEGMGLNNVGGFDISPDGQTAAFVVDRGTFDEVQLVDLTTLKTRPVNGVPEDQIFYLHWRPGSHEVGFTVGRFKSDVYSIDASLGTVTRWTNSETTFNPDVLPPPELISWKSFDGLAISGVYYRPARSFTGPRPVLINIHGGPDELERPRFQGRSNYLLNELGVAIIYPNVRGSGGFGPAFEQADNGRKREDSVKDIGALLDWIATRPELDKDHINLVGASAGGWLALEAGIVYNTRIRSVAEIAGITNLVTYLAETDPARQENRRQEYGDERDPEMRKFLLSISPVTRASELKMPTLIIQGAKDPRVPVAQAQELVSALKKNSATVWYVEVTNANHDNLQQLGGAYIFDAWILFTKLFGLN